MFKILNNKILWLTISGLTTAASGVAIFALLAAMPETQTSHDLAETALRETPPTSDSMDSYQVAAERPRFLVIEKLNIKAQILPMSLTSNRQFEAPVNIFDAGWYEKSALPAESGASLIDAHASGRTRQGLFAHLDTLEPGELITVERGDGRQLNYAVKSVQTVAVDDIDMAQLLMPIDSQEHGLNLITCAGNWVQSGQTYDQRVIVYALPI